MRVQTSLVLASWFIASAIAGFFAIQFSSTSAQFDAANSSQKSQLDHRGSGRVEV